jgi:hypothetical protein
VLVDANEHARELVGVTAQYGLQVCVQQNKPAAGGSRIHAQAYTCCSRPFSIPAKPRK